jgi:hypothetical protein
MPFFSPAKVLLTIFPVLLAGCANYPFINYSSSGTARDNTDSFNITTISNMLSQAPARGQHITVFDKANSNRSEVIFGEVYFAASGRLCSSYYPDNTNAANKAKGIICRNEQGDWIKIPLTINANQLVD